MIEADPAPPNRFNAESLAGGLSHSRWLEVVKLYNDHCNVVRGAHPIGQLAHAFGNGLRAHSLLRKKRRKKTGTVNGAGGGGGVNHRNSLTVIDVVWVHSI